MSDAVPSTSRAWQYTQTSGGLENNLKLNDIPVPQPKADEHLVRVVAASLNPVDYKPAEAPLFGWLAIRKPATPGCDIAGEIVRPAAGSELQKGQRVVGSTGRSPFAGAGLQEYVDVPQNQVVPIPDGVSTVDAAALPVAGLTAYQSLKPHVKAGSRVLLNGGSGGVGLYGIQIAKNLGCHVTVTCSKRNVELCRSFGADDVVDYTASDVIEQLAARPHKFDHVVDNVGGEPRLYWESYRFTAPQSLYVGVAGSPTLAFVRFALSVALTPAFVRGNKYRRYTGFMAKAIPEDMLVLLDWMREGKLKSLVETRLPMEQVPEAFRKLKTGRTRGKIVIDVTPEKKP